MGLAHRDEIDVESWPDRPFRGRSRKLSIRASGLRVRIDGSLDYWDGEP